MRPLRRLPLATLLSASLGGLVWGDDLYVSSSGSDADAGTIAAPFATIQHAVDEATPGTTIFIREGSYHEEVDLSGVAGAAGSPITIKPYDEEVVILDGTVPLESSWTLEPGHEHIYTTVLDEDITQLFVDERAMTLARFPNALVWSDEMWKGQTNKQNANGRGRVDGADIVGQENVSFEGCIGLFNFGNFETITSRVSQHTAGSNTFNYSPSAGIYRTSDGYFLEGGVGNAERVMLDMAQEWAYDETTKTLSLWADDGSTPQGRDIRGQVQKFAFTGDATTNNIVIDGLDFFATTFRFTSSDAITIQNCDSLYHTTSDRALGSIEAPEAASMTGSPEDFCEDFVFYNNTFHYSVTAALDSSYLENARVENNRFEDINYTCVLSTSVRTAASRNLLLRRNTLINSGPTAGFRFGRSDEEAEPFTVEYNYAEKCSRLQHDGTAFYSAGNGLAGSVWRYNWAYDNHERDFRFDGKNNPLTGVEANLYRNVSVSTQSKPVNLTGGAYRLKGDFHELANNIAVGGRGKFNVALDKGGNANTETFNNLADFIAGDFDGAAIPGTESNNFIGQNEPRNTTLLLRDTSDFDFRPKADAVELIDQGREVSITFKDELLDITADSDGAPDIGAYELGDVNYFIAGYQAPQASWPIPSDENLEAAYDSDLIWLGGLEGDYYNVYLGTDEDNLTLVTTQANNIYTPENLLNDQQYFWRVDTVLVDKTIVNGDVWTFTVNDHTPKTTSQRFTLLEDGSLSFTLTGTDPDAGDTLTFSLSGGVANGTLSGSAPNYVYTPNADFFGTDSLLFTANDGALESSNGTIIFDITPVDDDAPYFLLEETRLATAPVGDLYQNSVVGLALDPDESDLSYALLDGPEWLSVDAEGNLTGTPALSDVGVDTWTLQAIDPTGQAATTQLELRVVEGTLFTNTFDDFDCSLTLNSLLVDGSIEGVTVTGVADGLDYLYSVSYQGMDYDGDATPDSLTFEVRVKGWQNGSVALDLVAPGSSNHGSATIGTNAAQVVISSGTFTVADHNMQSGESLQFMIENVDLVLSDSSFYGNVYSTGFTSAFMTQVANTANSHQAVFGLGDGLLGYDFNTNQTAAPLNVGRGDLAVSSIAAAGTRTESWGVNELDFGIEVAVVEIPSLELLSRSLSGGASWSSPDSSTESTAFVYNNSGTQFRNRAIAYSSRTYQSDGGFRLKVSYTTGSIGDTGGHNFSFGLIAENTEETVLSSYTGFNPFRSDNSVYSIGVNLTTDGDADGSRAQLHGWDASHHSRYLGDQCSVCHQRVD